MVNKVLVLCQRKTGVGNEMQYINDAIDNLVKDLLGSDSEADIKYLSSKKKGFDASGEQTYFPGDVDFMGDFEDNDWTKTTFTEGDYNLIICNTCPYILMNYNLIQKYIKEGGYIALTAYNKTNKGNITELAAFRDIHDKVLSSGFEYKGYDQVNDAAIFQKHQQNQIAGKGIKGRKSRKSRKGKKSRKNKKSRKSRK